MDGFFETRFKGIKNGFDTTIEGVSKIFHQTVGYKKIAEAAPGALGGAIDVFRAAIDGLFSKDRGLLNPSIGYNLAPWKRESFWNPMRHVRKAVAAVLETEATFSARITGIVSAKWGNFRYRLETGIGKLLFSPFIGDISDYMGPRNLSALNDGSYQATNDVQTAPPIPIVTETPTIKAKEVEKTETKETAKPKGENVVEVKETREKTTEAQSNVAKAA